MKPDSGKEQTNRTKKCSKQLNITPWQLMTSSSIHERKRSSQREIYVPWWKSKGFLQKFLSGSLLPANHNQMKEGIIKNINMYCAAIITVRQKLIVNSGWVSDVYILTINYCPLQYSHQENMCWQLKFTNNYHKLKQIFVMAA